MAEWDQVRPWCQRLSLSWRKDTLDCTELSPRLPSLISSPATTPKPRLRPPPPAPRAWPGGAQISLTGLWYIGPPEWLAICSKTQLYPSQALAPACPPAPVNEANSIVAEQEDEELAIEQLVDAASPAQQQAGEGA